MTQTQTTASGPGVAVRRASAADPPPSIDGWELVEPVYEGPLARTYTAKSVGSPPDKPAAYAFKLLRRQWWAEPRAVAMVAREALVGHTVLNRHLIPVLAASVRRAPFYVVTPWLDGETLAARLGRESTVELPVALWIARQAAEALQALDEADWTHNDVKPANIFVSPSGHVTLLDLGFAAHSDETGSTAARRPVMGTCRYIAPEAITSALATDVRSDIHSLGAVLFEMLSGRPPFEADDLGELAREHRDTPAPELRRLVPHLPREVSRLVARMLAKQPLRRPQTPAELIDELASLEIATFAERSL